MNNLQKPQVFLGSSAEALKIAYSIQEYLELDANVRLWSQDVFYPSEYFLESIQHELKNADFGIFVFSPDDEITIRGGKSFIPRDNVLFELGLCIGTLGRERSYIFSPSFSDKYIHEATDLMGITKIIYSQSEGDQTSIGAGANKIRRAINRHGLRENREISEPKRSDVMERGSTRFINFVADGAIIITEKRHEFRSQLKRLLVNHEIPPTKYLYRTDLGSQLWLDMCRRGSYYYYHNSIKLIKKCSDEIAETINKNTNHAEIDFISLGPGDGLKDNILLCSITQKLDPKEQVFYYPIDISDSLIVESIRNSVGSGLDKTKVRLKAIIADFLQLPELMCIYEERPRNNVFSILGNTLGNNDEAEIISAISKGMFRGDFALIEINIGSADEESKIAKEDVTMKLECGPLTSLGVLFEKNLVKHYTTYDMSIVPGTATTVTAYEKAMIDDQFIEGTRLSIVHHYKMNEFINFIEDRMNVKTLYTNEFDGVGLLLVQRK